jgi:hypothetical protein
VALLADATDAAEKGDSQGVAAFLCRAGKGVLKVAQDVGTDVAAKVIVEMAKSS